MDKNKIIEAAAKLVAKGAYDKAIKEYQKILEVDPKDVRILQKMGELYQKKNDAAQAAQYFTRVAESYTSDGFFLKAVALYKQVLKLDPSLVDINIKLAELHQHLQLLGEAMAYYQIVANHHDKQGDTRASLEVLKKMVDLDPDNVASRVKLADLYVREGLNGEAMGEFTRAAEHLKRNNRIDDYLRVAERLSAMDPNNLGLARELAELYLQRNDQKRALAKLQICFKADSRDIETLRLLAVAFQGLGQTSKTLSVYKELARAYEDKGQAGEAEQVWQQVAQLDPNDADWQARQAAFAPPPSAPMQTGSHEAYEQPQQHQAAASATAVQATHQPVAAAAPAKPKSDNISKLLTETDVYVKYGLHDKALEHLRKVFSVEPENIDAHEKAYAIYVASNNHAQAFEQLLNVLRLHTRSGDGPRAQPYLAAILQQNPGHPEVPVFVQALRVTGGAPGRGAEAQEPLNDDAILVDSTDDDVIVADEAADEVISAEVSVTADEPLDSDAVMADEELALTPADAAEAAAVDVEPPPVAGYDDYAPEAEQEQVVSNFDAEYAAPEAEPSTGEFQLAEDEDAPTGTGRPAIPLSTAPGYQFDAPGLGDDEHEAPTRVSPRLDPSMLKTSAGTQSPLSARRAPVAPLETPAWNEPPAVADWEDTSDREPTTGVNEAPPLPAVDPAAEESWADANPDAAPAEEPVEAPPEEETASEECDEATFFIEQGLYSEAREILETILIAYPDHQRAAGLMAQLEQAEAGGPPPESVAEVSPTTDGAGRDAFDLAQELANELGDYSAETAAPELGGGDDYQVSVDEVFAEFKKGLEKVVKPEDVDTHYDLGVAYKEMGLIDDAVSEFSIARKGCIGKRKEVDCLSMMGLLQMMKGDFGQAVEAFTLALGTEHAGGDTEKALRYDLASAYEGGGQAGRALSQYLRVQTLDGGFRDVAAHVDRLSAIATPEDDPPAQAPAGRPSSPGGRPARKVGYV